MKHIVVFMLAAVILFQCISTKLLFLSDDNIPEYLSITAKTNSSRPLVFKFIRDSLEHLLLSYPNDKEILKDFVEIFLSKDDNKFNEPDSWHTTCLYIGANYSKLNTTIYQNFPEGREVNLTTSTFVYIPGKIMTAPVFFEDFDLIENKFPHVTLLLGEYHAVDSNYVLKALFERNKELKELYQQGHIKDPHFRYERKLRNVTIDFEDCDGDKDIVENVYLLKFGEKLLLKGLTTKNY